MFRCEFSHLQYQQPDVRMKLWNLLTALICPVHPAFLSHALPRSSGVLPKNCKGHGHQSSFNNIGHGQEGKNASQKWIGMWTTETALSTVSFSSSRMFLHTYEISDGLAICLWGQKEERLQRDFYFNVLADFHIISMVTAHLHFPSIWRSV